ncbi:MAG: putative zinc-binding metallopeptidase [Pirellulaceae bacterium]
MAALDRFRAGDLSSRPIRDLGLTIAGTPLEPVVAAFQQELERLGIRRLRPDFYLSTEWGVNFGTLAIGIPFYLARPELTAIHAERIGYLEGGERPELLRFLRHEMGHVVNYAYKLYEQEEWTKQFGSIAQPYEEDYRPEPFSRRFVRHLPGWYAQMHPDEDWAETFAVWMTPDYDWRAAYADSPDALAKLEYCDRTMGDLITRDPEVTATERDEDVGELTTSLEQIYLTEGDDEAERFPPSLDGALQAIFENVGPTDKAVSTPRLPAAVLIRRVEQDLMANVYRWTGHFPERTRSLLRYLAARAEQLRQVYPADRESSALIALATLVTGLAMNHVLRGSYYL